MGSTEPDELAAYQAEEELASAWAPSARVRRLETVIIGVLAVLLGLNLVLVAASTVLRYFFHASIPSGYAVSNLLLAGLVFLGSAVAFHHGEHRSLRLVLDYFPAHVQRVIDASTIWMVTAFACLLIYSGVRWLVDAPPKIAGSVLPGWVETLPILVGSSLLVVYCVALLLDLGWRALAMGLLGPASLAVFVVAIKDRLGGLESLQTASLVFFIVLLLLLFLGMPVAFCFGVVTACLIVVADGAIDLSGLSRRTSAASSDFILTAIPFFVAAGFLMEAGDITHRITAAARAFVGHIRGGMAHVTVGSMYFMSGVTGSEAADVAAVGTVMRTSLRSSGWTPAESTGILVASSVMGATVPPSIGLIIVGAATSLSVGALFMGGFLPAAVLGLVLMSFVYVRARAKGILGEPKASWRARITAVRRALLALGLPAIVVYGMVSGFATPTELSAICVFYVLLIELGFYRRLRFGQIMSVARSTAIMSGMILFIVATASGLVYIATFAGIPQLLGSELADVSSNSKLLYLFLTIFALVPLGMLMEGIPALLIFPPLLLPTALLLGANPYHYATLMFIAVLIGANMPPLGAAYYFATSVMRVPIKDAMAPAVGYLGIICAGLAVLILVPDIVLILPTAMGFFD